MKHDLRDEMLAYIKARVTDIDDIVDLIIGLEPLYDFRACLVTRNDVESEFEDSWRFDSDEHRKMTEGEWQKFCSDWFWRKGHSEVMWDGVADAIRWDLRDCELLPKTAVVE
jgi:hypothetical protein